MFKPTINLEILKDKFGIDVDKNGFVKTYNSSGYMRAFLLEFSEKFVGRASDLDEAYLEVGSGIGNVIKVLCGLGIKNITAVDSEPKHLDIIASIVGDDLLANGSIALNLVEDALPNLQSLEGQFFDKILCAQVIHYLSPKEFECALKTFKRLLAPGGELCLTSGTPYIEAYKSFLPTYEGRLAKGHKYPGYIEDVRRYHPRGMNHHGGSFLFFSEYDLKNSLQDAGYKILESGYEDENRNSVGIIVQ